LVGVEEYLRGRLARLARAKDGAARTKPYALFLDSLQLVQRFPIGPFDQAAENEYQILGAMRLRIGTRDQKIAAIALATNAILVTRNHGAFRMHAPPDWYQSFFTGLAVEMWLKAMPSEATESEVAFLRAKIQASPPARLLDVPCGGGRHSIALAAAGFSMTGVDLSTDFLHAAKIAAPTLDWRQREMTDLPWKNEFDGAFCFGNSFGYLPDDENARFLNAVAATLKPGARFIIDYPVCMESLLSVFQPTGSYDIGDIHYERNGRYDAATARILVEHAFTRAGPSERKVMTQRVYTYRELCELLTAAGFTDMQGYGGLNDEPFTLGSKRLLLLATKRP
jgi:SAM-dependent methyltransferase